MRNKWIVGITLWVFLVLVQVMVFLITIPTDGLLAATITIIAGTALTIYMAITAEEARLERVKKHNAKVAMDKLWDFIEYTKPNSGASTINEHRIKEGLGPVKFDNNSFKPNLTPSAHYVVDAKGIHATNVRQVTLDGDVVPIFAFDAVKENSMSDEDVSVLYDKLAGDFDNEPPASVEDPVLDDDVIEICKHCYRQMRGLVHIEGMGRGKMRCDPEDTQGPYGYNAEATGKPCGVTCLGHP